MLNACWCRIFVALLLLFVFRRHVIERFHQLMRKITFACTMRTHACARAHSATVNDSFRCRVFFFYVFLFLLLFVCSFVRSLRFVCQQWTHIYVEERIAIANTSNINMFYAIVQQHCVLLDIMYYIVHCLVTMMKKEKWKQIAKFILHTTENVRTHRTPANFIHFLCAVQRELQLQRWIGNIRRIA